MVVTDFQPYGIVKRGGKKMMCKKVSKNQYTLLNRQEAFENNVDAGVLAGIEHSIKLLDRIGTPLRKFFFQSRKWKNILLI